MSENELRCYKLAVVFDDNWHQKTSSVQDRPSDKPPLTYFKDNTLKRCYFLIEKWKSNVNWARIYHQKENRTIATYTSRNGWNNQ